MKILYHHRTASKDGQAVHIEELIHALRLQGHEVRVVGPGEPHGDGRMGGTVGWVQRLRAKLPKAAYELLELTYSLIAYRRLLAAARAFGPDVIYERYNLFLLAGALLSSRTGIPLLLEINAPLADERAAFGGIGLPRLAAWAESRAWRAADVALPVTAVLAARVRERGVDPTRIEVVPNGINEADFDGVPSVAESKRRIGLPDNALVLGFTGFVRDWHGVDSVVRWLAEPGSPKDAHLVLVGDGPARSALENLAKDLGVEARFICTGVVDRSAVPALVNAFDIALQPAVVPYASPLKLFEYLALGKAIVAPRTANLLEVLDDEVNALLFDPAEACGLGKALHRLSEDSRLRARLAEAARATIHNRQLTWGHNAQRVAELAARQRSSIRRRASVDSRSESN